MLAPVGNIILNVCRALAEWLVLRRTQADPYSSP